MYKTVIISIKITSQKSVKSDTDNIADYFNWAWLAVRETKV